jgi:hypothetical protein
MVDRLYPIRSELRGGHVKLLASFSGPGCAYLGGDDPCQPILWKPILPAVRTGAVADALARRDVDFVYLDQVELENPAFREAAREAEAAGWIHDPISADQPWLLLRRPGLGPSSPRV